MFQSLSILLLLLGFLLHSGQSFGLIGKCGDERPIPQDKTRKFRNNRLNCSARTSHFIRIPSAWNADDWENWRDLEIAGKLEDRKKMQAIGQKLPEIKWSGVIHYTTIESWDWTDRVLGPHPSCGFTTVMHTRSVIDEKGRSRIETYTTQEMNTCIHDETRSESRFCSKESMTYEAKFERGKPPEWQPGKSDYFDILPNKYDLLPGEVEDVQISNNIGERETLTPVVEVGDAWNDYKPEINIEGFGHDAPCEVHTKYRLNVNIVTLQRKERRGPNAFRTPTDEFGRDAESLEWNTAADKQGNIIRSTPRLIKLTDASDAVIAALSRHSQDFNDDQEAARIESGQGQSEKKETHRAVVSKSPFWKNTFVRIVLNKMRKYSRDIRLTERLYNRSAEVNFKGIYDIPLFGGAAPGKGMYRSAGPLIPGFWSEIFAGLEPGSSYQFLVSMYNSGVPFYAQDCNDEKNRSHWSCRLGVRSEDSWYSKPLVLDFVAAKTMVDERPAIQKFADFQRKSLWGKITSIFD